MDKTMKSGIFILAAALACGLYGTAMAGTFGDGYKNAKWGMAPDKVKEVIQSDDKDWQAGELQEDSDGDHSIEFTTENKKLTCLFFKEKLYQVKFEPFQHDRDEKGVKAVLKALKTKYGSGRVAGHSVNIIARQIVHIVWDDGTTEIELSMADPEAIKGDDPFGIENYPSSLTEVLYTSKQLKRKVSQAEKQREQKDRQKDEEDLNAKAKKAANDL
jgi:hypothetical protein